MASVDVTIQFWALLALHLTRSHYYVLMDSLCEMTFTTALFDRRPLPHTNGFRLCQSATLSFAGASFDPKPLLCTNGFSVRNSVHYNLFSMGSHYLILMASVYVGVLFWALRALHFIRSHFYVLMASLRGAMFTTTFF